MKLIRWGLLAALTASTFALSPIQAFSSPVATAAVCAPIPAHYDGISEGEAGWTDPNTDIRYVMHARMSVKHEQSDPCGSTDYYAFRFHGWCTWHIGGGFGYSPCNFDLRHAALGQKLCGPSISCGWSEPWGNRDFYLNWQDTPSLHAYFTGLYHIDDDQRSHFSRVATFKYRFVSPDHLTNSYTFCSQWSLHATTVYAEAHNSCSPDLMPLP